jgi:hypothetical protein
MSMGEEKWVYKVLVARPEGSGLLGKPKNRWKNSIKVGLREAGLNCMDWIHLLRDMA